MSIIEESGELDKESFDNLISKMNSKNNMNDQELRKGNFVKSIDDKFESIRIEGFSDFLRTQELYLIIWRF